MEIDQWGMFTRQRLRARWIVRSARNAQMAAKSQIRSIDQGTGRSNLHPAIVSVALSILFLIVYGGCNWITVTSCECRHILLLAGKSRSRSCRFFILPYMSIDLFFVAAPFLCRTDRELSLFTKRTATAILVAGVCFLIWFHSDSRFRVRRPKAGSERSSIGFAEWTRHSISCHRSMPR